jgi:hypothetical protein
MRLRILVGLLILGAWPSVAPAAAEPLAEKYLVEGKLAEGAKALQARLGEEPRDDQARFGLGVVQFLQSFEHLGAGLYRYGLRTEGAFGGEPRQLRDLLPQNPRPETITYAAARQILQTWVDDLARAEATLARVQDPEVKLPLHVGLIQIDPLGRGKPVSAALVFRQAGAGVSREAVEQFYIGFDRGDVCWLRGYCHFLAAWGELLLAVDGRDLFDCTAHLFFEKVESPYPFLQEEGRDLNDVRNFRPAVIADAIAFIHQLRLPVKEPERCKAALGHLEAMLAMAREMWKFYLAETDDDHEWIPNPRQKGVLQVAVTQEMVDTWLATVGEAERVLQGKRLVPFWRGTQADRGVNLRRVFTEPRTFDPILWFQGTAATPYLEKGEVTQLADRRMLGRIGNTFGGGFRFVGFAFWFN